MKPETLACSLRAVTIMAIAALLVTLSGGHAQNSAHTGWDLLDKPVRRALWHWQTTTAGADVLIDFCKNKSINEVYLFVAELYWGAAAADNRINVMPPDELAALIRQLNAAGISRVWGLYYLYDTTHGINYLGDTAAGEHIAAARQAVDLAARFNLAYPDAGLYGLQNDNEPQNAALLPHYIEFCRTATLQADGWSDSLRSAGARPLLHSAAMRPGWIHSTQVSWNGRTDYMGYHLLSVSHHAVVMNYTDNNAAFIRNGATILRWADELPGVQRITLGIEVNDLAGGWPGSEQETWFEEIAAEDDATRFNSFEAAMDAAQDTFLSFESYERIAIHSFNGYFAHWFGASSPAQIGPAPGGTPFADLTIDASHWADDPTAVHRHRPDPARGAPPTPGHAITATPAGIRIRLDKAAHNAEVLVFDLQGQCIMSYNALHTAGMIIPWRQRPAGGLYLLHLSTDGRATTRRLAIW